MSEKHAEPAPTKFRLSVGARSIPLRRGTSVRTDDLPGLGPPGTIFAQVMPNPQRADVLGLQNLSDRPWTVHLPDGQKPTVEPLKSIRLAEGIRIDFGGVTGLVSLVRPAPPAAEFNERVVRAEMERLSRKLHRAACEGRLSEKEFTPLHQAFIARDEAGGFWSFGLKTRQWYRMAANGQWQSGTAPEILFLRRILESLRALEKRTAESP